MALLTVEIDGETLGRLAREAVKNRRNVVGQAEVILMQAVGTFGAGHAPGAEQAAAAVGC